MSDVSVRFYMSVPRESMAEIDMIIDELNKKKSAWQSKTKAQDVIRAFIKWALKQDLKMSSHYGKGCYVDQD